MKEPDFASLTPAELAAPCVELDGAPDGAEALTVLRHGLRCGTPNPPSVPDDGPGEPTTARPGSAEKIAVLEERARRRQPLFHPDDPA